ncbi:E3 ubiquitin-protein ligase MARCHF9-like isoform X2 [Mugil cephalus]|uniref:E3 ubiquitin-protein ligase MARCHF9-like isoform X2 n=1 Tax=Mugil cephalus TaxID=48193 RepID=UPI001FB5D88A|nr:E3 ubiquitin-protein ligase MARCHF9-like isoform X2 [Mugil cephalus]
MFKYQIRMLFNELKVLLLMRSGSSRTNTGTDTQTRMRGLTLGGCTWPQLSCSRQDDEEEYYGSDTRPRSLAFEDKEEEDKSQEGGLDAASLPSLSESGMRSPQCRICFQGPEKWQAISLTVIEKVQIAAIILGSLFLIASISWLVWSSLSPSAKWQRQDLLFQICYGMYGFMDIVCIGLIIHEGSSVYRIFKRWQAVNQQWKVLNYEKAKDLGDPISSCSKGAGHVERDSPHIVTDGSSRTSRHIRTILHHHCGYTILHILSQLRPNSLNRTNHEVVMRVTTV